MGFFCADAGNVAKAVATVIPRMRAWWGNRIHEVLGWVGSALKATTVLQQGARQNAANKTRKADTRLGIDLHTDFIKMVGRDRLELSTKGL